MDISKNAIEKVLFCSDYLRIVNSCKTFMNQNVKSNIEFIYHLFSQPILSVLKYYNKNIVSEVFYGVENGARSIKALTYRGLGLPLTQDSWAYIFNNKETSEIINNNLKQFIDNSCLVVGYEIPPFMLNYFEEYRIPFIDIRIHAVRFLKDLMFSFFSNIESIYNKIKILHIDDECISRTAAISTARTARIWRTEKSFENSLLFVGQTPCDASLIANNKMVSPDDIIEAINQLAPFYETIYYKKHPLNNDDENIKKIIASNKKCENLDVNIYDALAKNFDNIVSFSSSVNIEARYFGRNNKWILNGIMVPYHNTMSKWITIPVYEYPFYNEFWNYLLSDEKEFSQIRLPQIRFDENVLRFTLNMRWGR